MHEARRRLGLGDLSRGRLLLLVALHVVVRVVVARRRVSPTLMTTTQATPHDDDEHDDEHDDTSEDTCERHRDRRYLSNVSLLANRPNIQTDYYCILVNFIFYLRIFINVFIFITIHTYLKLNFNCLNNF